MTVTTWNDLLHPGKAKDFFSRRAFLAFEPFASGYSRVNALWLAELSRLVYRYDVEEATPPPKPGRCSILERVGLRQRRFFQSQATHTQAMLVEASQPTRFAVLAFRGTEQDPRDFMVDISVRTAAISDDGARAHGGFVRALDSVWRGIDKELSTLDCPVFYTGHSLGGALASLAALRRAPRAVYTFGSPLVGNGAFATALENVPIYRVVNENDAVTRVPPEGLGFQHVGQLQRLNGRNSDGVFDLRRWFQRLVQPPAPLADHAPINYVDRI